MYFPEIINEEKDIFYDLINLIIENDYFDEKEAYKRLVSIDILYLKDEYDGFINNHEYVISYCPDKVIFPEFISLNNFLYLLEYCSTKRISDFKKKIDYYLELFKLQEFKNTPIIKLSLGSKQKILIIQALIKDADVYIFDEPLNGLDNESQKVFIDELKRLKEEEKLILIITHNISKYPLVNINQIDLNYAWTN